jgi:tRNA(His) 5'-end guanylyltransferase
MRESLESRMREYEAVTRAVLPRRTHTIIRVDGRRFSKFLAYAEKPFDGAVVSAMDRTAEALCREIAGARFAYTQSDEVSVLVSDFATTTTQPWFGGVVQKIASVAASVATVAFNAEYGAYYDGATATFDARVFTVPDPVEVGNYFLWRQRDGMRNAISMAARAEFSHRALRGVSTSRALELLAEAGIDYATDYDAGVRRGRVCIREVYEEPVTFTHKGTGKEVTTQAIRSRWKAQDAPVFESTRGWLPTQIAGPHALRPQGEGHG